MKTKSSKALYESGNSLELIKVAIVGLLVSVMLIGTAKLVSAAVFMFN
jgi:hypothetical protein